MAAKYFSLLCLLFVLACTEEIPIGPVYTGQTNWVPQIVLYGNNYRRFALQWRDTAVPPLEVKRNIDKLLFELKPAAMTAWSAIDSIYFPVKRYTGSYDSPAILNQGTQYTVRLKVRFLDGSEKNSNEITFVSPFVEGQVLKRIYVAHDSTLFPDNIVIAPDTVPEYHPVSISFDGGYIYAFQYHGYLTRVDTLTREIRLLTNNLYTLYDRGIENISVKDGVFFLYNTISHKLLAYDANSLEKRAEIQVKAQLPAIYRAEVLLNLGSTLYLYLDGPQTQIAHIDAASGEIIDLYETINYSGINPLAFDGKDIWIKIKGHPYMQLIDHYDPSTNQPAGSDERQVPVFEAEGLAWDGNHFWVFDPHSNSFAKIKL